MTRPTDAEVREMVERKCPDCEAEVDKDGEAKYPACYYCPEDGICSTCGSGQCDQSC